MISLATICHHTKLLQYHWLYSSSCTFQPCDSSTQRYWRFLSLNPLHLFHTLSPTPFPLVQFSCSVMSDSLGPQGVQHPRPPCPSPPPRVYSNSCLLSQWYHPTILSSVIPFSTHPQSFPASGFFQWVSSSHQVAKFWSFSFSISPSNKYSGLISFKMDWFDLLAVQGTLKSLLQHHSSKASVLQHLAFFTVQLSHPYMTTGKTIALTRQVTTFILCTQGPVQLYLFICFVFQLPHISEIIWCFSFSKLFYWAW